MAGATKHGHGRPRRAKIAVLKALAFIQQHATKKVSLGKVAKAVKKHPNYLSEQFKQVTGLNFVEYVARARFEKACDYLLNSNRRISQIAFTVGFQSLSQFNRTFKRFSGRSPTQYRASGICAGRIDKILRGE